MVAVSRVSPDDLETRAAVERLGREAFPTLQGRLVSTTEHTLVARREGGIVGGAVLKIREPRPESRVGLVQWIFTADSVRGAGVGQRLLESAIEYFDDHGCERVLAIVEWKNTSSSKLFATRGFTPISTRETVDSYGLGGTVSLWWWLHYYIAPGHHLWARTLTTDEDGAENGSVEPTIANGKEATAATGSSHAAETVTAAESPSRRWRSAGRLLEAVIANVVLLWVVVAASSGVGTAAAHAGAIALVAVGFLAVRHLPRQIATAVDDEPWRYRSWGNSYPFGLAIAALGGYLPMPGGLEPASREWTYRHKLDRLGPASFVSALAFVGLFGTIVAYGTVPFVDLSDRIERTVTTVAIVYVVLEILAVVWPFDVYNGRVVYDWNRLAWVLVAVPAALSVLFWVA